MQSNLKAKLLLHFTVIIWGFTGVLGRLITAPSDVLVLYRMSIAAVGIWIYFVIKGKSARVGWKKLGKFFLIGGIIGLHWITFFESIKVSNISVALICISSASLFTAILEPLFFRRRINPMEIFFGLIVIGGLSIIFNFEPEYQLGVILSLCSAFLAAFFTVLNGVLVKTTDSVAISAYEISGGALLLIGYFLYKHGTDLSILSISATDLYYLLILGLICTSFAFVVSVNIMKQLTPFTVTLSINLEPIYAIIMAFAFFGEYKYMGPPFFIGAAMILCTVIANAFLNREKPVRNRRVVQTLSKWSNKKQ